MENNCKENSIDFLNLLYISSELYFPFSNSHYTLNRGLCLITDNPAHVDRLIYILNCIGECEVLKTLKVPKNAIPNYTLGVHLLSRNDTAENSYDFFSQNNFLVTIVSGGIVPDFMDELAHIIVLFIDSIDEADIKKLAYDISSAKNFLRNNPEKMTRELLEFESSREYLNCKNSSELNIFLTLAARMYRLWYRSFHTEPETEKRFHSLLKNIKFLLDVSKDYTENVDIADTFVWLFQNYVEKHMDSIHFYPADQVNGNAYKELESDQAVLYDINFYFVTEPLLKEISDPLISAFGWNNIKDSLRMSGLLVCGNGKKINYTCKRTIISSYGAILRPRFVRLVKEFFVPIDGLAPDEKGVCHDLSRQNKRKLLPGFQKITK